MPRKNARRPHWLNDCWWKLAIGEWIALTLAFLGIVLVFCLFFIRRQSIPYRFEHSFNVSAPEFIGSALALAHPTLIAGNRIELLQNGDSYFPAMLEAIRGARQTINFEAYIFYSDAVGAQFRDALCERAHAGVEVRVLLDGIGSSTKLDNSYVRDLKNAGCKFTYYHPVRSWRVDRTNRRTHRRVLVVDGRLGFTGSVGFAEKWSGNAHDPQHWRDMQVRIEGPLVAELQAAFQQHWVKAGGEALSGAGQFPRLAPAGDLRAQIVTSQSFSIAPVPLVQATAFTAAEKRIWIVNAYVTPTNDQVQALVAAVRRGVDVKLLAPGAHDDQPLTKSAGRAAYGKLLEGGVKIYEYQPTMIHTKAMVVDGLFTFFGSSNLDARSSEINEELDLAVYDAGFAREVEQMFAEDLKHAQQYTVEQFHRRSVWERTTEWLMLPFRSQM